MHQNPSPKSALLWQSLRQLLPSPGCRLQCWMRARGLPATCCPLFLRSGLLLPAQSPAYCPGTANLPVPMSHDPKGEILETWAHLKLGGVSVQSFPEDLVVGTWARLGPEAPLVSAFSKSGPD